MRGDLLRVVVARRVEQPAAASLAGWSRLAPEEAALLGPGATGKRRAEFLAGRLAAKEAVARLTAGGKGDGIGNQHIGLDLLMPGAELSQSTLDAAAQGFVKDADGVAILRATGAYQGQPRAVHLREQSCQRAEQVSISHVDGVALAAASWQRIGLDLMTIEALGDAFIEEAFAPEELSKWANIYQRNQLGDAEICTAFAAKEAALKWLGCGLRVPLHSVVVTPGFCLIKGEFSVGICQEGKPKTRSLAWTWRSPSRVWVLLSQGGTDYR